ncbi:Kae1-associated serine/threonine protein kinase [Candidatus Woesearchaeota archaeon]|nr:Kae1-associated serine/threonine protein kinase [Candidatus Woesearchaeota archaeon]
MPKKLIAQGAEAKLFLEEDKIIKNRFKKSYRIKEIDEKLRGFRTRREAKVLQKLEGIGFPAPRVIKSDDKENIVIEKIEGKLVKDILENSDYKKLCGEIGRKIAILHNNSIIHGDLTTSNMILNKEIYFIDFGLSFFSDKAEDKAVDLHLLKEGLESKHYKIWEECFKCALDAYKKEAKKSFETLKRLEVVEKRGRYRAKKGS